tara:strand:- start:1622 stop:2518 length:897 start_codon:yes stop_codon:yes gene_type:complete
MSEIHVKKIKVKCVLKSSQLPTVKFTDIKDKFESYSYFQSGASVINKINANFGMPSNEINIQWYDDNYEQIVPFILDVYTIRQHSNLTSKFAAISAMIRHTDTDCTFLHRSGQLLQVPIEMHPTEKDILPWDEMTEKLQSAINVVPTRSGACVLHTYLSGYPLRLGDIVSTSIHEKHGINWLDPATLTWTIRASFTKQRKGRSFQVSQEYMDKLMKYIHPSGYMVSKRNGTMYKTVLLRTLGIHGLFVNDIRNSYETYNHARDDISLKEKHRISNDVLGHTSSVAIAHYTPNSLLVRN